MVSTTLLAGCVSVRHVGSQAVESEGGGVAVRVFADDAARKADALSPRFVVGELDRQTAGSWQPVFRSLDPAWTVLDLPPGKYRLQFPALLDDAGNALRTEDEGRTFRVKAGQISKLEATLSHTPKALIAAGVVTAVVAGVLLHDWLDDHGLPKPPLRPDLLVDVAFAITLDFAHPSVWGPGPPGRPPVVTSHFPQNDALVAARRVRVIFALSEPLGATELPAETVTVLAEDAGLVPGYVTYDPNQWWVTWESNEDLPSDDVLHVTLDPDDIEDLGGRELAAPVSFSFRTAG